MREPDYLADFDAGSLLLVANWESGVGYAWWLMESFWAALARAYSPTHRVLVAFPQVTTISPVLKQAPLEVVEAPFAGSSVADLQRQARFLRQNRVRVIYFSDRPTWALRYLWYRVAGVQAIVTHDHTPGLRTVPQGVKRLVKQSVHRFPGIAVDGAVGATEFVRERLVEVVGMPASRCFAAPNGLPPAAPGLTPLDVHATFGIEPGRNVLVMTGRANRYKNVEFVLEVLAGLAAVEREQLCFLFVGDGPDLDFFRQRATELGVAPMCIFAGRRDDVPAILRGCELAVHPSRGEVGYSLSILEYMQAGLPVLVPDNPSVCAATTDGETGLVYREGDVADARAALRRLVADPAAARRMGAMTKRVVEERFRLEDTHRALLAAFRSIDPAFPVAAGAGRG